MGNLVKKGGAATHGIFRRETGSLVHGSSAEHVSFDRISDEGKARLRMAECSIVIGLLQYMTTASRAGGYALFV